jgi:hypothetical protein
MNGIFMIKDVKNQHFVWRHYLKPWLIGEKIWCFTEGKIATRRIRKIAKDIYFYKAEELTPNEKVLIWSLIEKRDPIGHKLLSSIYSVSNTQ